MVAGIQNTSRDWVQAPQRIQRLFSKYEVGYLQNPEPEERQFIDLAFPRKRVNRRRGLSQYRCRYFNYSEMKVSIGDFVNKDLKHFSNFDNIRSIPYG